MAPEVCVLRTYTPKVPRRKGVHVHVLAYGGSAGVTLMVLEAACTDFSELTSAEGHATSSHAASMPGLGGVSRLCMV